MIRKINNNQLELTEALQLVWRTFLEFEASEYSAEGVQAFKEFIAFTNISEKLEHEDLVIWGYYEKDQLVGVIAVREANHISLLFVEKEQHHKGIARALYTTAVDYCFKQHHNKRITVNSSPYAVEVYKRLGFSAVGNEETVNGIRFTPMAHFLS